MRNTFTNTFRTTFTRKEFALAAACALALAVFSEAALAQARDINEHALLLDSRGAPVMSGFGLCVHTGFGPAPAWTVACHGPAPVPAAQYVAPAAVAPVAMPGPAPVVLAAAAALPVYEKVAFDANVLFDSDKSALRPAGRDALDEFVSRIHGLDSQSIVAIGYADRMGSHDSNQALSERRVDAVKAYLVGKGIKAERVETSARGETAPTTSAGECKDAKNAKNVACMQPDRHVFIEISGTRIAK
jgi:OOP family OmpA-OmpF porin